MDGVWLVRAGAAVSGIAASAGPVRAAGRAGPGAGRAAPWSSCQLLPGTFDVFSYGNLSNVFAQSHDRAVLRLVGRRRAGGLGGGRRCCWRWAPSATSPSLVVLVALVRRARRGAPARAAAWTARARLALARRARAWPSLYYASLLAPGPGPAPAPARGRRAGPRRLARGLDVVRLQVLGVVRQWGLPAVILAALGPPGPRRSPLDRDLAAYWVAGAALALPAVLTPLDVRYLYALTLPVAVAGGMGPGRLWPRAAAGGPRCSGRCSSAAQCALAAAGSVEAVLQRYRL